MIMRRAYGLSVQSVHRQNVSLPIDKHQVMNIVTIFFGCSNGYVFIDNISSLGSDKLV